MQNDNKRKNPKRKNKKPKNKKQNQLPVNGVQNQNKSEKDKVVTTVPAKVVSTSPRPSNLQSNNNKNIDFKRSSGSEYEDFQTPSAEYDIKNEDFDENKDIDISPDFDKEWEEIGSFKSSNLEDIVEQDNQTRKDESTTIVNCTSDATVNISEKCNGCISFCYTYNKTLEIPLVKCRTVDESVVDNVDSSLPMNENDAALIIDDNRMECKEWPEDNDESVTNANYVMCVNQFFEDIDDDGFGYPVEEELFKECEYNAVDMEEVVLTDDRQENSHSSPVDFKDDKVEEIAENQSVEGNEMMDLICTEENLTEETLSVRCICLNIAQEPYIQKSMTLRPRPTENTYDQSATSITIVTSISEDNIQMSVDKDFKSGKNYKTSAFKLYRGFIKKFKKTKTPEKESPKKEFGEHNLSLRSGDLIKDSEIESNQSLKSINDSQNFPEIVTAKDTNENQVREELTVNEAQKPSESNLENGTGTIKSEKSKMFLNILKKKPKPKKDPDVATPDELIPTVTNEEIVQSKLEIESDVFDDYHETVKSLMCDNSASNVDKCVIGNEYEKQLHPDVSMAPIADPCFEEEDDDSEDHLFPDAITATKILGPKPVDVPYIDDPVVSKLDYFTIFNGESKRLRISAEFFVPRASMETLFFADDSMNDKILQKSLISQSPCRRKRVLGNILGCMSRGR